MKYKYSFKEKKILPTINIFCPLNLNCWNILRKASIEYGKDFCLRI